MKAKLNKYVVRDSIPIQGYQIMTSDQARI